MSAKILNDLDLYSCISDDKVWFGFGSPHGVIHFDYTIEETLCEFYYCKRSFDGEWQYVDYPKEHLMVKEFLE